LRLLRRVVAPSILRLAGSAVSYEDPMKSSPDESQHGFRDRAEAGQLLAQLVSHLSPRADTVVFGLPRGGVPVAFEIARSLHAPLDIIVVLKLSIARYPELALGAVAAGGSHVLNEELVHRLGISTASMAAAIAAKSAQLAGRSRSLRDDRQPVHACGAHIILVDDGLATGASMRAAIAAIAEQQPARVVVAVPVASQEAADSIRRLVDDVVCVHCPASFVSVGNWYQSFAQVSDDDVRLLLDRASRLNATEKSGRRP
jgi:putative phosphoribosyl transferase